MAKIRKNASIESGLMEVLKILSDDEINKAIGKTSSYIRKCSNPDLAQQIDHNDSFKLDQACISKGKAPPLLTAYEYMIAQLLDKADNFENKDINEMLIHIRLEDMPILSIFDYVFSMGVLFHQRSHMELLLQL